MYLLKKNIHRLLFVIFALLPLLFISPIMNRLKIANLIQKNEICDSLTFYYDNDRPIKVYDTKYCYVFLPSFADLNKIDVETTVDTVIFSTQEQNISVEKGKRVTCQFQADVMYEVSFLDKKGNLLTTDTVIFLKSDKLPTLYIETATGSMDSLNEDKTYSETGSFELVSNNGQILFADNLTSISARGNETFSYPKKSYQIDIAQPENLLDMGESDTWILLSNVTDSSYIRNKLTYDMAIEAGMEGSPQSEYIDVYFNDVYGGMYLLTEKVELADNRLDYLGLDTLNKAANNENIKKRSPYISDDNSRKAFILPSNPQDITGGYLIERDYGTKFELEKSGFITDSGEKFVLKDPEYASVEQINYISNLMQEIEDAIMAPDGINPATGKHYTEYIDLDSWVNKYLVEEISRNNGGGATSSYFYKPSDSISSKIYGGPVWDYDKAYGNFTAYNQNTRDLAFLTLHASYTNWFYYLYQQEDFVYTVKNNYKEFFSDYMYTIANEKIDEYIALISASAKLDNTRFHYVYEGYKYVDDPLDYVSIAESIRTFILERKNFLDQAWIDEEEIIFIHFRLKEGDNNNRTVGVISGETLQNFPTNDNIAYWKNEETGEPFTLDTPATEEITLVPVYN